MELERVIVQFFLNIPYRRYRDILELSPAELLEISRDINFLANVALPVDKKFAGRKIDDMHRKIRVLRAFSSVEVTREIEIQREFPPGLYDSIGIPTNFVYYDITDRGFVEDYNNYPGGTMIGSATYTQEEVRNMRKD